MAKTARLTGLPPLPLFSFPGFLTVIEAFHQTVFRQIVRPVKTIFSLKTNRPPAENGSFNQEPARTAETHIASITAKRQHFSYGKVEFFTAAQT